MKLFVYAGLMHPGGLPATAFGECRKRGEDKAAHFSLRGEPIKGQVQACTAERLAGLDKFEAPEYKRKRIFARIGDTLTQCWAYEYIGKDWDKLSHE